MPFRTSHPSISGLSSSHDITLKPDQAKPVEILNIARVKFLILLQLWSHAAESLAAKARNNLRMRSFRSCSELRIQQTLAGVMMVGATLAAMMVCALREAALMVAMRGTARTM